VTAGTDKGKPVASLRRLYARVPGATEIVGLGDSLNDLELLAAVDIPIVVRNAAGGHTEQLMRSVRGAMVTTHEGPAGWYEAVTGILDARVDPNGIVGAMSRS
jgi:mannosyl-3-phosphoglycerate phosphatase